MYDLVQKFDWFDYSCKTTYVQEQMQDLIIGVTRKQIILTRCSKKNRNFLYCAQTF